MGQGESVPMSEISAARSTGSPSRYPGNAETLTHQQQQQYIQAAMMQQQQQHNHHHKNGTSSPYYKSTTNGQQQQQQQKQALDNAAIAAWQQQQLQYIRSLPPQQQMQYYQQYQQYMQQQQAAYNAQRQQQQQSKSGYAYPPRHPATVPQQQQQQQGYYNSQNNDNMHQLGNKMGNISISNSHDPNVNTPNNQQTPQQQLHTELESDWNKAWENDNDDDDDSSVDDNNEQKQPKLKKDKSPKKRAAKVVPTMEASPVAPQTPITKEEDSRLSKQADLVLQEGVKWDTDGIKIKENQYEKPSVEMFFPLLRVLGKGSFGKVVLVRKRTGKESGGLFAMKILRKAHLVKRRQIERTKTERKVLSVVDHPFIMKLHFAFQGDEKLFLVLDYCPGGELFFHLSRYRRFPERVARFYAAELLLAIGHLHRRGIIYRDLKPENVLLDAEGHVKLGDFGLAKDKITDPCSGATSMCGTPEYMAPEVLSQAGHGFCVDYWGLGMLVYEMMTGLPPWYTTDRQKLFKKLKSAPLEIPSYFTNQSASVVTMLLDRNPRNRLGVTGIRRVMEHEFFQPIQWKALLSKRIDAPIRPCEGWKVPDTSNGDTSHKSSNNPASANPQHSSHNNNISSNNPLSNINDDQQKPHLDTITLDAATANFDKTFTRMPVETEDNPEFVQSDCGSYEGSEELNEKTFTGFTFDHAVEPPKANRNHTRGIPSSQPQKVAQR